MPGVESFCSWRRSCGCREKLRAAIELYQEDVKEHQETVVSPISSEELIEFLRDTEPDWYKEPMEGLILRPIEVHEVPSYA